jgi:hypothetical protein
MKCLLPGIMLADKHPDGTLLEMPYPTKDKIL